jgi:hypothetical protein
VGVGNGEVKVQKLQSEEDGEVAMIELALAIIAVYVIFIAGCVLIGWIEAVVEVIRAIRWN